MFSARNVSIVADIIVGRSQPLPTAYDQTADSERDAMIVLGILGKPVRMQINNARLRSAG